MSSPEFMNRDQWGEIYDIARYNGYAVHQLVVELCAVEPNITEPQLLEDAKKWSRERTSSYRLKERNR
jgi:hypothetical protein